MTAEFRPIFRGFYESSAIGMSIPIPRETESRDAARTEWDAIAANMPEDVRDLAEEFISLCERIGALNCGSGCVVDDMGSDGVLFDWNDGHLPILSIMIGSGSKIAYSGKFKGGGRVSGTDFDLSFVTQALTRMMEECGLPVKYTSHSPVLSMRVKDAAPETVVQSYSFHTPTPIVFLFSQQLAP